MSAVIDDQVREVRTFVRDVLARDVEELVRTRTTSPGALQTQLDRVEELGAFDAALAADDGGLGPEGGVVVVAELARVWPSLGWAAVPHALVRVLGVAVPQGRIGLATPALGGSPAAGALRCVEGGSTAESILVLGVEPGLLRRAGVSRVERVRELEGLRDAVHADLVVPGPVEALGVDAAVAAVAVDLLTAAVAVGIAEASVISARDYQRQRVQFHRPISEFGEMRAMLADGAAQARVARDALLTAVAAPLDAPDARSRAAAVLLTATAAAVRASEMAQHSHGGYGHMVEFPVHGLVRDARAVAACAGSTPRLHEDVLSGVDLI